MRTVLAFCCTCVLAVTAALSGAQEVLSPAANMQYLPPVEANASTVEILPVSFQELTQQATACACASGAGGCSSCGSGGACGCDPCGGCGCGACQCPELNAPCLPCPRINLLNPAWNLLLGGTLELDFLFNEARPVAPGVPFFLAPGSPIGASQATFDAHARQTSLFGVFSGPEIGNFKAGGYFLGLLFNDALIVDRYGFLPVQAFGELRNEDWRFAAGLQMDIFAPLLPNVLPFSFLAASGNPGVYRGQLRAERFLVMDNDTQWTVTGGISDPVATTVNNVEISEDNGWPDVEMRLAWATGPEEQVGLIKQRPFEVGISSVVGQLRTISGLTRVVANVWGLAGDFRWRVSDAWGVAGEVYNGQAIGTYGAGIFQNVNAVTFAPVHASGGWMEVYYYLNPCLHTHVGFGIDDPVNTELAPSQIGFNRTIFTNLIWEVSKSLRLGGELTFRETDYITFTDNDGVGFQGQAQWRF